MNKKFNLILLFIFISCILLTCFILPSNAASQTIVTAGGNQFILNDVREAWSYAVYLATRHGEAKITLGDNFYAFDSKGTLNYNGTNYKYDKYAFGVNMKAKDLNVGFLDNYDVIAYREGSLYIPPNTEITIDLNGYCIDRRMSKKMDDGEVIYVSNGGTLTIIDSKSNSGGVCHGASSDGAGGIHVHGTLNFASGRIFDCSTDEHGGAIYVSKTGTLNMTGGIISNCKTNDSKDDCNGGAIYIKEGKCNLSNCIIENCNSEDNGGAVYLDHGKLTCDNVTFRYNRSKDKGGAVYLWEGNSTFTNCTFIGNSTEGDEKGGAIFVNTDKKYSHVIKNCTFKENASGNGGALLIEDGPTDVIDCYFENNYCKENGAAIRIDSDDGVRLINNRFEKNRADDEGGGIYINGKKAVISGVIMLYNEAKNHGGAIYVDSNYDLNIQGYCRILDNKSLKKHTHNVALQETSSEKAYIYAGSIEEGSLIRVASTGSGENNLTKKNNLSQYQFSHYFAVDGGTAQLKDIKDVKTSFITSVFSNKWNWIPITIGIVAIIGGLVFCIVKKNKKKGKDKHEE